VYISQVRYTHVPLQIVVLSIILVNPCVDGFRHSVVL